MKVDLVKDVINWRRVHWFIMFFFFFFVRFEFVWVSIICKIDFCIWIEFQLSDFHFPLQFFFSLLFLTNESTTIQNVFKTIDIMFSCSINYIIITTIPFSKLPLRLSALSIVINKYVCP